MGSNPIDEWARDPACCCRQRVGGRLMPDSNDRERKERRAQNNNAPFLQYKANGKISRDFNV